MSPTLFAQARHPQSHLQSHPPGGSDRPPPPPPSPDPIPATHTHTPTLTHPTSFLRTLLHPLTPIRSKRARPRSTDTVVPPRSTREQGHELTHSASSGATSLPHNGVLKPGSPPDRGPSANEWESQMLEWAARRGPASLARRGSSPVPPPWEGWIQSRLELAADSDRGADPPPPPPRKTAQSEVPPSTPPVSLAPRSADKRRKLVVTPPEEGGAGISAEQLGPFYLTPPLVL